MAYVVSVFNEDDLRVFPDAESVEVSPSGAIVILPASGAPLAGFFTWTSFRRIGADELAELVEVG